VEEAEQLLAALSSDLALEVTPQSPYVGSAHDTDLAAAPRLGADKSDGCVALPGTEPDPAHKDLTHETSDNSIARRICPAVDINAYTCRQQRCAVTRRELASGVI